MPHLPHKGFIPPDNDLHQPTGPVTSTAKITIYLIGGALLFLFLAWIFSL
jgi:hypothetical protein